MDHDLERLVGRVERLERRNRLLTGVLLLTSLLAAVGWQANPVPEVVRARRFEVLDARGVPLVALEPNRADGGGAVVLRDSSGEKRGWWRVTPEGGNFTMNAGDEAASTAGIGVGTTSARLSLISPKGASASASVENDAPRLDLYSAKGATLFGAPWKR